MRATLLASLAVLSFCLLRAEADTPQPRYAPLAPNGHPQNGGGYGNGHPRQMQTASPTAPPEQTSFYERKQCEEQCAIPCTLMRTIMPDGQEMAFHFCKKLKPVEKSLHERFIAQASWTWLAFLAVVTFAVFFCCSCLCYQCCCKSRPHGSQHSSREPLHRNGSVQAIDEILGDDCKRQRMNGGSKYVVDV